MGSQIFAKSYQCKVNSSCGGPDKETWKKSKTNLDLLLVEFTSALQKLNTDEQKSIFCNKLHGLCIEGRTAEPMLYAASISSNPNLSPFYDLMGKYEAEARIALTNTDSSITIRSLAEYINEKHGGTDCLANKDFPDGKIDKSTSIKYLMISNSEDDLDTVV